MCLKFAQKRSQTLVSQILLSSTCSNAVLVSIWQILHNLSKFLIKISSRNITEETLLGLMVLETEFLRTRLCRMLLLVWSLVLTWMKMLQETRLPERSLNTWEKTPKNWKNKSLGNWLDKLSLMSKLRLQSSEKIVKVCQLFPKLTTILF